MESPKYIQKQTFGPKADECFSAFLFGKLSIHMQLEHSTTGKNDASTDEIEDFIQHRFQNHQLKSNHQLHPFNQMSSETDKEIRVDQKTLQSDNRQPPKCHGTYFHCIKRGHKIAECRTMKREDAAQPQQDRQDAHDEGLWYKQKLVCNNCGYSGHSARDCRQQKT